jgi:hypothetical protein
MRDVTLTYILDAAGNPHHEPDLLTWVDWIDHHHPQLTHLDRLPNGGQVRTTFLGTDQRRSL